MAFSFSQSEIDRFKECFFYISRKGFITSDHELGVVMRSLGFSPNTTEISEYFKKYSKSDQGGIDFASFLEAMHEHSKVENVDKELLKAFKAHDTENRGYVPATEVRSILMNLGEKLTRQEVDTIFRESNVSLNGQIQYNDFIKSLMMPVPDY